MAGTPPPPFVNAGVTGQIALDNNGVAITGATDVKAVAPTSSLNPPIAATDTMTVNGTTITFTAAATSLTNPPGYNISTGGTPGTVQNLLTVIDTITGNTTNPSTISATGQVTLNTGLNNNLSITDPNNVFASLGFLTTPAATRTGGGTVGTGFVIGNDLTAFDNESISGGAVTIYNAAGTPINVQLRWAKTDSASLGAGHTDTWNLFYQNNPTASGTTVAWTNVGQNFAFNSNGALTSLQRAAPSRSRPSPSAASRSRT